MARDTERDQVSRTTGVRRYKYGPIFGCKDSPGAHPQPPEGFAQFLVNWIPINPQSGFLRSRPRWRDYGAGLLGVVGNRRVQGIHHLTTLAGGEYRYAVAGGRLYRFSFTTGTFTDLGVPSGVAISPAARRVWMESFADHLIVSDGVNRPWKLNPVTGVASYLTQVPGVWYGPPVVHSASLIAVKNDARHTIIWSNILDPDNGYEMADIPQRWVLGQTAQDAIVRLLAANRALFYFRSVSTGAIIGDIDESWGLPGSTTDAVSADEGTLSPGAVIDRGDAGIWFLNQHGQVKRVTLGNQVEDLSSTHWSKLPSMKPFDARLPDAVAGAMRAEGGVVLFTVHNQEEGGASDGSGTMWPFNEMNLNWLGQWQHALGRLTTCYGWWKDDDGIERLVMGTDSGYICVLDDMDDEFVRDGPAGSDAMMALQITFGSPGGEDETEKTFDYAIMYCDEQVAQPTGILELTDQDGATQQAAVNCFDKDEVGFDVTARWAEFILFVSNLTGMVTFNDVELIAYVDEDEPEAKR